MRGKAGDRRPGGGGGRDGRLRIAALANGRAAVRVLGSGSLRADAVDHRRASSRVGGQGGKEGPGVRRPEVGCGRDGRRRMTALVDGRATVRLLGSASRRRDAVGRRGASSRADLFWAKCSAQGVAPIAPVRHLRPADAGVCASRRGCGASGGRTLPAAKCSAQDVAPIAPRTTLRPTRRICGRRTPESVLPDSQTLPEYSSDPHVMEGHSQSR
jgi:hypothetical protein